MSDVKQIVAIQSGGLTAPVIAVQPVFIPPGVARQADLTALRTDVGNMQGRLQTVESRVSTLEGRPVLTAEYVQDVVGGMIPGATYDDAAGTLTLPAGSTIDAEAVRDIVAAFAVAGSNVTVTHNDVGNTLTFAAAGTGGGTIGPAGADGRLAPRSTGGSPGQLCYRKDDGTLAALTPAMDAEFDRELVMLNKDNQAVIAGHPADVTGMSAFVSGRDMYVVTPGTSTAPNLAPTAADGSYPVSAEPNATQRFLLAGRCTTSGTNTVFTLSTRAYVARSGMAAAAPTVTTKYLDATDFPLNANAVPSVMTNFFSSTGQGPFPLTKRTDADSAGGTGFQASPVTETISGAATGVSGQHYSYGGLHILTPNVSAGWDAQENGSWFYQFQTGTGSGGGTMDVSRPGLGLRMVAPIDASTPGRALGLRLFNNTLVLQQITLNLDRTFVITDIVAVGVPVAVNVVQNILADLRGTDLKVKVWAAGTAEPAAWTVERPNIPITGAGVAGVLMRQDWHRIHRFSRAIGTGGKAPFTRP